MEEISEALESVHSAMTFAAFCASASLAVVGNKYDPALHRTLHTALLENFNAMAEDDAYESTED